MLTRWCLAGSLLLVFVSMPTFANEHWTLWLSLVLQLGKNWNVRPVCGAWGKDRQSPNSLGFILWGPWLSATNSSKLHPIVTFESDAGGQTDRQGDYSILQTQITPNVLDYKINNNVFSLNRVYIDNICNLYCDITSCISSVNSQRS